MRRRSITSRVYLVLVPLFAMGLSVGYLVRSSLRTNSKVLIEALETKALASEVLANVLIQDDATKSILVDSVKLADQSTRKIAAYDSNVALLKVLELSSEASVRAAVAKLNSIDQEYLRPLDTTILETLFENAAKARDLYFTKYEPHRVVYEENVRHLIALTSKHAVAAEATAESNNRTSVFNIIASILFGMLVVVVVLAVRVRGLSTRLALIAAQLAEVGSTVKFAGDGVRGSSHTLATDAEELSSAVDQVGMHIDELSKQSNKAAESATKANELSDSAKKHAQGGETQVTALSTAMTELAGETKRIHEAVSVIEDLAFQTDLLALNAAVEAARAGEQGRGFAVVADAVRQLAAQSAGAAKEIAALIQSGDEKARRGIFLAAESSAALSAIVTASQETSSLVSTITDAGKTNLDSVREIQRSLQRVAVLIRQNSDLARNSANASDQTLTQIGQMELSVGELHEIIGSQADLDSSRLSKTMPKI